MNFGTSGRVEKAGTGERVEKAGRAGNDVKKY